MIGQKGLPARSGGVERHVEELATRLAAKGHEVFVYCRRHYTPATWKTYHGVRLITLPSVPTKHLDAITHTLLATIDVLFRRVDIVHYHAIGPSMLLVLVRLFRPRVHVVSTFHCQDYFHQKWGRLARWYLRLGEYVTCRFPQKTIAVAKTLAQHAWSTYQCETAYIPNGTTVPKLLGPKSIQSYGLQRGSYILAVGRLVRHKGFHTLIEAYKAVKTDKKLVIVGGSAFTDAYVRELHRRVGDHPNILLIGPKTGRTLRALYSNALFVVQPSEAEGMSMVLLEALGHGKTVLASDIPEHREVLAGRGFFFRSRSVPDCVAKMTFLLTHDDLLNRKGVALRAFVRAHYDWGDIVDRTIEVYRGLAHERPASRLVPKAWTARMQET